MGVPVLLHPCLHISLSPCLSIYLIFIIYIQTTTPPPNPLELKSGVVLKTSSGPSSHPWLLSLQWLPMPSTFPPFAAPDTMVASAHMLGMFPPQGICSYCSFCLGSFQILAGLALSCLAHSHFFSLSSLCLPWYPTFLIPLGTASCCKNLFLSS